VSCVNTVTTVITVTTASHVTIVTTATTATTVTTATTAPNPPSIYTEIKKHKKQALLSNIGLKLTKKIYITLTYCLTSQP